MLNKKDYQKKAKLLAGLLCLAIKEQDFGKADQYLKDTEQAIEAMRKKP